MTKNEYFTHDYFAREDEKIELLIDDYGMEGYGVWWAVVEICYQRDGFLYEKSVKSIAKKLGVDESLVLDVLTRYNLFCHVTELDGYRSESIMRRLDERKSKSDKARASSTARWKSGQNRAGNADALHPQSDRMGDNLKSDVDNFCADNASAIRPHVNDDTDACKTACGGNAISNQIKLDDINNIIFLPATGVRAHNQSHLEEAVAVELLRESAQVVYGTSAVVDELENMLLNYLDSGKDVVIGDVTYDFGGLYKRIMRVQNKTIMQIVEGHYVKDKHKRPSEWPRKKITNPLNYALTVIIAADDEATLPRTSHSAYDPDRRLLPGGMS